MKTPQHISFAEAQETVDVVDASTTLVEAAKKLGITVRGIHKRLIRIKELYGLVNKARKTGYSNDSRSENEVEVPDFPDEDLPTEELIAHAKRRFEIKRKSWAAHTWFPVKFKDNLPIGLLMVGDPHLDDNGCNWPELETHIKCAQNPGIYGVNIGDSTNNWTGRLMKLYAMQDSSVKTARKLVEWFMLSSGIQWLVWILGNHDVWGDGAEILAQMAKRHHTRKLVCHNWEARFQLKFPNGWDPKVYAAHNFKGYSMWNPAHGPMREGQMGEDADIYVCGDLHQAINVEWENAKRRRFQKFVRVRGYKFMDDYARQLGFDEQEQGCSALVVFDPQRRSIQTYMDVVEGTAILQWKRKNAQVSSTRK